MVGKLDTPVGIDEKGIDTDKKVVKIKKKKIPKLPKIKDVKLVSIDIGSKYIKILEAKKRNNIIHITSALKIESPNDIIEKGEIRNLPSIVNALNNTFMKWRISTKDISFNSISSGIMSREISIIDSEDITLSERQMLVENKLKEYLPINLEDYQIQFTVAGKFIEDEVKKLKVLVIVYPIKQIKSYLTVVSEMGNKLRPCSLDVTNNSVQKFFNHVNTINNKPVEKEKVHLFIDMGRNTFNASIIADGKLQFMRLIEASQDAIDRGIALRIGKSYEEAEVLKMEQCSLMHSEFDGELTDEQVEVTEVVKANVNGWIDEIKRLTQFYSNKEQRIVEKIYIYGGGAKLNGLADYMQDKIEVETERIVDFDGIEINKGVNIANIDQFINSIGTVIRF